MSRLLLIARLARRDLRRHSVEAALLVLALTAATAALTIGLVLRGVSEHPYQQTRVATDGPDVVAQADPPPAGRGHPDLLALRQLMASRSVLATSGPFPLAPAVLTDGVNRAPVIVEGRIDAASAVDHPAVTEGKWAPQQGAVVERAFADALGLRVGDHVRLNGELERIVGVAVTASESPYPLNVDFATGRLEHPGLVWLAPGKVLAMDSNPSYVLELRLAHPDLAPQFVGQADAEFAPTGPLAETAAPPPFMQSSQDLAQRSAKVIRDERTVLVVAGTLLGLMALGSIAVLVGGRMAEQIRRAGLLKAVGSTPSFAASVLLTQYLLLALLSSAIGLAVALIVAPTLITPSLGLLGAAGAVPFTGRVVFAVTSAAFGIVILSTLFPAIRASRRSTVDALLESAWNPNRIGWLTALSAWLPASLLLGLRLAARRPRRALLGALSAFVAVGGIVAALAAQVQLGLPGASSVPDPRVQRLSHVLFVVMAMLIVEAGVNAAFAAWATTLDTGTTTAVARALGATGRQVFAGLCLAQALPAALGALLGVPEGLALFQGLSDDASASLDPWKMVAVVATAVLVTAALSAIPARLSTRKPVVAGLGS